MAQQSSADDSTQVDIVDNAVASGGAYEIIRKRLIEQGKQLDQLTQQLNEARLAEFGSTEMRLAKRIRVRTENNCVPRDIVQVGTQLLFGFNVFIGLKKETRIEDVFALFQLQNEEATEIVPAPMAGSFLADPSFVNDFEELYKYYKHTKLVQLSTINGKLLAGFQIGERLSDIRVFRWSLKPDGSVDQYIDNRGERDIQLPPSHDFEWVACTREDSVNGRHPHYNILDKVFVETIGGDLTIKVENNTEDGLGIYREPVEDKTQSLDDAEIHYAEVGSLILLKVLPYREEQWRYLIFNTLTQQVSRIDAIGQSCVQLPEDHGLIFPGGYYLQNGEQKTFDDQVAGMRFKRRIRSPNGEDVLYLFYEPDAGIVGLFAYNLITKSLQNPIYAHGYALADDGRIVLFTAGDEPTRIHPMQVWETPFVSDEYASKTPASDSFFGRIGNAELVRGISALFSLCRMINSETISSRHYEKMSQAALKLFDDYYWLDAPETQGVDRLIREISQTAELVIDEFEKVESIRQQSQKAMKAAEEEQSRLLIAVRPEGWDSAPQYVSALSLLRKQRGHLATLKELRYIDLKRIQQLDQALADAQESLSDETVRFLSDDQALAPWFKQIEQLNKDVEEASTRAALLPLMEESDKLASELDLISELMSTLKVDDATVRTRIIDGISEVYALLNQSKANAKHKHDNLGSQEAMAQFGAQFKLFSQSIANALAMATTPNKCDEQLSRLLVQLEELESQFSEYEQFLADIMSKREEVYESFESHKQQLIEIRQRKAQSVKEAAERIISSIQHRTAKLASADDLNTFFASDALVLKSAELIARLRELDSNVIADDIEAKLKALKDQALRALRDQTDLYEGGGHVIKLGKHRFSVNTQPLDLTIIPKQGKLHIQLTGTDFYAPLEDAQLEELKPYWSMTISSETENVYRAEYLAWLMLQEANKRNQPLPDVKDDETLLSIIREFAAPRYQEGYQKGIHDHDAMLILQQVIPVIEQADLLKYSPDCRALAQVFWTNLSLIIPEDEKTADSHFGLHRTQSQTTEKQQDWTLRAQSAKAMYQAFGSRKAINQLENEIAQSLQYFLQEQPIHAPGASTDQLIQQAARYLVDELSLPQFAFIVSPYGRQLADELKHSLDEARWQQFTQTLNRLNGQLSAQWQLVQAWLEALIAHKGKTEFTHYIAEAIALLLADEKTEWRRCEANTEIKISGLLGEHPLIQHQCLQFALDQFLSRMQQHHDVSIPKYKQYLELRQQVINDQRKKLKLDSFKPKPLTSFVRNRLINEAYLPIIGDNLAKQMGTVGENKRSDLMGLLMMISPPGYGKTTLMEYVASKLGLIFMKINCPSLGHEVHSLDPARAPNATAQQELEKLNLALEMGSNVMLYLDDIQHTHPEFLQKFISLCDGTRRIEGVWEGETKTYDMRGRKFCVVMAGNPYTESGEAFKVPDMLANRADIYNLGDILGGMDEIFALSYIENALTSNPVLAPMATRDLKDLYLLVDRAKGKDIATTDLSYAYSGAEINEITGVLKKLLQVQSIVLKVNQQYIASAAQDDNNRTEPSFKLQGSYRNMNKMAEKVSAVMNDQELMQMISDHYQGEAQMLTTGAEENLLKLAELRGNMTEAEQQRWESILHNFQLQQAMGGDSDNAAKVVGQLIDISQHLKVLGQQAEAMKQLAENEKRQAASPAEEKTESSAPGVNQTALLEALQGIARNLEKAQYQIEVVNQPDPGIAPFLNAVSNTLEKGIFPLVKLMEGKLNLDLNTQKTMSHLLQEIKALQPDG